MEKRKTFCRKIPSNLCRYSILKKEKHTLPLIKHTLPLWTTQWLPSKEYSIKMSVTNHVDNMYPWYGKMRMALYLCGLLPINIWPQVNHEKNIKQISTEGHSTKYLTSILKTVKIIRNKTFWETIPANRILRHDYQMQYYDIFLGDSLKHKKLTKEIWIKYAL